MLCRIRRRDRSLRQGVASMELALLLPFLMFLWVVTVDWARIFYYTVTIQYAARDGAYFEAATRNQSLDPNTGQYSYMYQYSSAQDAALGESTNINPTPTVTVSYDTAYNGTYTNTTYSSSMRFVKCKVDYTFTMITNFPIPGFPSTFPISREAKLRIPAAVPS